MANVFEDSSLKFLADEIDAAAWKVVERLKRKRIAQEPSFTEQLLTEIRNVVNRFELHFRPRPSFGFFTQPVRSPLVLSADRFDGRSLGDRGRGSEESETGADILIYLDGSHIEELAPRKGLLAQAKMQKTEFIYTSDTDLFKQCSKMSDVTASSFALIYAINGIFVFNNPINQGLGQLHKNNASASIGELIADFIDCTVGDAALTEIEEGPFVRVARNLKAKRFSTAAAVDGLETLVISA